MKHGFVEEMENVLDKDIKITHSELAKKVGTHTFVIHDSFLIRHVD
jgi:nucleosome binding factor SPN SPT16 subunit